MNKETTMTQPADGRAALLAARLDLRDRLLRLAKRRAPYRAHEIVALNAHLDDWRREMYQLREARRREKEVA